MYRPVGRRQNPRDPGIEDWYGEAEERVLGAMGYRADIDGLRAIAVLLVLVFHFDLFALGDAGFIGVDVFFVISGYLITCNIWRDLERQRFPLRHFYAKRVRRLAPALIAVQLLVIAVSACALLPREVLSVVRESVSAQVYLSNVYYWKTLNYFGLHGADAVMLHTWSLAVEEQFYLFYPLFLLGVHRWARRRLVPSVLFLIAASFAINLLLIETKPQAAFYLLPPRAWEFGIGALIPALEGFVIARPRIRALAPLVAALALIVALATYRIDTRFPGWFALLPTGAALCAILGGAGEGSVGSRLLSHRLPVTIGRISYSLYLVHWPLLTFGRALLPSYGLSLRWLSFALSFLIAGAIYRWVEVPMRVGGGPTSDRRTFRRYVAALALVFGCLGSAWWTDGWRFRFGAETLRYADAATDRDPAEELMEVRRDDRFEGKLRAIGVAGVEPHWLIFGDSHAGALTRAFSLWLAARGEAGVVAFRSRCMPVVDSGDEDCRRFTREALSYVRMHRQIGNIFLVSIWREPLEAGYTDRDGRLAEGAAAIAAFDAAVKSTLVELKNLGARTFVWEALPAMPTRVPETLARNLIDGLDRPVETSLADHLHTFAFLRHAFAGDPSLVAGRVRPEDDLCARGRCRGVVNGRPLFWDNNHPALASSEIFARILSHQMRDVPAAKPRS